MTGSFKAEKLILPGPIACKDPDSRYILREPFRVSLFHCKVVQYRSYRGCMGFNGVKGMYEF